MTPGDFQQEAMAFANEFMVVFKDRAITPYIHTLVNMQHFLLSELPFSVRFVAN